MDADDTETWITGGYNHARDDFTDKTSAVEYSESNTRISYAPTRVKSRAELILTEVEEQLKVDESRYDALKLHLEYMQTLYQGVGPLISETIDDYKQSNELPMHEINSPHETTSIYDLINDINSENPPASEDTEYYDFLTDTKKSQRSEQDESEPIEQSPKSSARSLKNSPRRNIYLAVPDENSSDSDPQNDFSDGAENDRKTCTVVEPLKNVFEDKDILRHHGIQDASTTRQHPYQLHLAEYSKGLQDEVKEESRDTELQSPEEREIYSQELLDTSRKEEAIKKEELFLNLTGSVGSVRTRKIKKSGPEKYRKISNCVTSTSKKIVGKEIDDTFAGVTKIKRRKKRLKTSNSRSTIATRDASIPESRKDARKRKQRGHSTILPSSRRRHESATKIQQNGSDVVEIYHNSAVKSRSISVISTKHSKLEPRGRNIIGTKISNGRSGTKTSHKIVEDQGERKRNRRDTEEGRFVKEEKNSRRIDDEGNHEEPKICQQIIQPITDSRSGDEPNETKLIYQPERSMGYSENKIIEECNEYQRDQKSPKSIDQSFPNYSDPLANRNYELPTVASKLKQVNRSYFNRFNFRNLPFVVGTSVTPSFNLGLNIQETLSLIKTRQMIPGGIAPLLIKKVSKGMRPVSTLLGYIGDRYETPGEATSDRLGVTSGGMCDMYPGQMATIDKTPTTAMQPLGRFTLQTPRLTCVSNTQSFYEARQSCGKFDVPSAKKRKTQSICSSMKFNSEKIPEGHPILTRSALLRKRQDELNFGDCQTLRCKSAAENTKGIQEVLKNYHDQFEAMCLKSDKLKEQAEKSSDKSLLKEIEDLEKKLTAKEEEISAVVSLYKEVMTLKQQMKMIHERNSFVCVATEFPGSPVHSHVSARPRTANPIRMINMYCQSASNHNRGPSTSTRLAGLLRQIKIFQKQLKSTS